MRHLWWMLPLVAACDHGTDTDAEAFLVKGDLTSGDGADGMVRGRQAFGFATAGRGIVYVAANGAATCADLVEYLDRTELIDPSATLMLEGHCNLTLTFDYDDATGWDGLTEAELTTALWSVSCAMDEGDWEVQSRQGVEDYFYSGRWWQGSPDTVSTTLHGADGDVSFDVDMNGFSGNFIYEEFQAAPATGTVSGAGVATTWCPQLAQTPLFGA